MVPVGELEHRRRDRDAALLLQLHPVGGHPAPLAAGLDRTGLLEGTAVEEELLGQRGLARVGVADDGEGATAGGLDRRGVHPSSVAAVPSDGQSRSWRTLPRRDIHRLACRVASKCKDQEGAWHIRGSADPTAMKGCRRVLRAEAPRRRRNRCPSSEEQHQRLGRPTALAVFASDAISSTAYATEEILLVLVPARRAGRPRATSSRSRSS